MGRWWDGGVLGTDREREVGLGPGDMLDPNLAPLVAQSNLWLFAPAWFCATYELGLKEQCVISMCCRRSDCNKVMASSVLMEQPAATGGSKLMRGLPKHYERGSRWGSGPARM